MAKVIWDDIRSDDYMGYEDVRDGKENGSRVSPLGNERKFRGRNFYLVGKNVTSRNFNKQINKYLNMRN